MYSIEFGWVLSVQDVISFEANVKKQPKKKFVNMLFEFVTYCIFTAFSSFRKVKVLENANNGYDDDSFRKGMKSGDCVY